MRRVLLAVLLLAAFPPAAQAAPVLGVYAEEGLSTQADVREPAAAGQAAAGLRSVRLPLVWREAEPEPRRYAWARMDEAVAAAARNGITVLPFVFDAPAWASGVEPAYGDAHPPRDPSDYAAFAAEAVRRYGPGGAFWAQRPQLPPHPIRAWEVWNEPNLAAFWGGRPSAPAYAALLRAASTAIHDADPGAEVLMAGLPDSQSGTGLKEYLSALYAAGGKGTFDSLSVHAYAADPLGVLAVVHGARRVAAAHGDAGVGTWVTEFGWASAGEDSPFTADEAGQARLVARTAELLRRVAGTWDLRGLHYFNWADPVRPPTHHDIWPFHAGLLRADGSPKPALAALSAAFGAPVGEASGGPARPPRTLRVRARVRSARPALGRRGVLAARVGCRRACEAGLALVAFEPRPGRAPARHVLGRWTRDLRGGRRPAALALRLPAGEAAWVRRHGRASLRLQVTALAADGALGARELRVATR